MKNYTINYKDNTITVTKRFMEDAGIIGSTAFTEMKVLREMGMAIVVRQTKSRKSDKITYIHMLQYISCVENSYFYMSRFEAVCEEAKSKKFAYPRVLEWFNDTFPNFNDKPEFNENNEIIITPADYPKDAKLPIVA